FGDELASDRVGRVGRIDQRRHLGGDGDGISIGNRLELLALRFRSEAGFDQAGNGGNGLGAHGSARGAGSATGVQRTSSMRLAPVARTTSRSKPSAMPLAGGIWSRAARKSSSIG